VILVRPKAAQAVRVTATARCSKSTFISVRDPLKFRRDQIPAIDGYPWLNTSEIIGRFVQLSFLNGLKLTGIGVAEEGIARSCEMVRVLVNG
jgi:hypothetical protein